MRFIIYGAGAIGCTIGGRLALAGHETTLIARGEHLRAIQRSGLRLRTPDGDHRVQLPAVGHPQEVAWRGDEVVILAMKTQDTERALVDLELAAGASVPVFCAQNGVENERLAARRFERVYAMLVALPATFLVAGEVIASAAPLSGCLHCGLYAGGTDELTVPVCAALRGSRFHAEPSADAMDLKYRKLLLNLGNGVEVVTGRAAWGAGGELGQFVEDLRAEALDCYRAAGIRATSAEEYVERVTRHYKAQDVGGEARSASSTLQSVMRGHTTTEVDYLNGEIVLLGSQFGVPTPLNRAVRAVATAMAAKGEQPGAYSVEDLRRMATQG
jgi:2-dehydropantoate 2-reductase